MRGFFDKRRFVEVNTPLLQAGAGGAVARPFETYATELSDTKLNLRVAPELFLKRLIVGGVERVYEIGPAFRNEGVDATHNPEFTTCEFYSVMTSLQTLMYMTEELFRDLAAAARESRRTMLGLPDMTEFEAAISKPFPRLEFIPTIENAVRKERPDWSFPNLAQPNAEEQILQVFALFNISMPRPANLPRLLDGLAAHFIEPLCTTPTFITHHPECMSPLAKSFLKYPTPHSATQHRVSARAELFIQGREYVNCYEEENSPIEQRRKFEEQLRYRREDDGETHRTVDESYISALEWGMPPTGGWGCGVDRIVMLFAGKKRIADVLPFGTLRNVVALGSGVNMNKAQTGADGEEKKKDKRKKQSAVQEITTTETEPSSETTETQASSEEAVRPLPSKLESEPKLESELNELQEKDKNKARSKLEESTTTETKPSSEATTEMKASSEEATTETKPSSEKAARQPPSKLEKELSELQKMLKRRPKE